MAHSIYRRIEQIGPEYILKLPNLLLWVRSLPTAQLSTSCQLRLNGRDRDTLEHISCCHNTDLPAGGPLRLPCCAAPEPCCESWPITGPQRTKIDCAVLAFLWSASASPTTGSQATCLMGSLRTLWNFHVLHSKAHNWVFISCYLQLYGPFHASLHT